MSRRVGLPAIATAPASASVVDVLTGNAPVVPPLPDGPLTLESARALTERIRHHAREIGHLLTGLQQLVDQAREREAWSVLGYPSWPAYLVDVLEPMRLPRDERRQVVGYLTGQGLSSRAIAPLVQADPKTVVNDRRAIAASGVEISTPEAIVGLDGKEYSTARPTLVVVPAPDVELVETTQLARPSRRAATLLLDLVAGVLEERGTLHAEEWVALVDLAERRAPQVTRLRQ